MNDTTIRSRTRNKKHVDLEVVKENPIVRGPDKSYRSTSIPRTLTTSESSGNYHDEDDDAENDFEQQHDYLEAKDVVATVTSTEYPSEDEESRYRKREEEGVQDVKKCSSKNLATDQIKQVADYNYGDGKNDDDENQPRRWSIEELIEDLSKQSRLSTSNNRGIPVVVCAKNCDDEESHTSKVTLPSALVSLHSGEPSASSSDCVPTSLRVRRRNRHLHTDEKPTTVTIIEETTSTSQLVKAYPTDHHDDSRVRGMEISLDMGGKIEYGWYSGPTQKEGKPCGIGVIRFQNNDLYMGEMENGEMHGRGTLVSNMDVLKGDFEHNLFVV